MSTTTARCTTPSPSSLRPIIPSVSPASTVTSAIHPCVYSINLRVFLKELAHLFATDSSCYYPSFHRCRFSERSGGCLTLEDIPDRYLDWIAEMGFQYVYLIGAWTTGNGGFTTAQEFIQNNFPTVPPNEICSSPFAITAYEIHPDFGGLDAFKRFRRRLTRRHVRLILDFIPNHMGIDHPWVVHPTEETADFIIHGDDALIKAQPQNYYRLEDGRIVAHGRDLYFDGWKDTAQLNYFSTALRKTMINTLEGISDLCDGVRCDMAMLVNSDVFKKTWGNVYTSVYASSPSSNLAPDFPQFWPQAISRVLMKYPNFLFLGEVYWDLESQMMDFGFQYVYDKKLYDGLKASSGPQVQSWILNHPPSYHVKACHFLENHDELRAANVWPDLKSHRAAATIAFTLPGMKLFHFGQFEGRKVKIPMQRCRLGAEDQSDEANERRAEIFDLYYRLLDVLNHYPVMRRGVFEVTTIYPSSLDPNETGHVGLIGFTFYETRGHTGYIRNLSNAGTLLSSLGHPARRRRDSDEEEEEQRLSDQSSSVPRSSMSDLDMDEISEMTNELQSTAVDTSGPGDSNRKPKDVPPITQDTEMEGDASVGLHPTSTSFLLSSRGRYFAGMSRGLEASLKEPSITLNTIGSNTQSIVVALDRSLSDTLEKQKIILEIGNEQRKEAREIEIEKREQFVSDRDEIRRDLNMTDELSMFRTPITGPPSHRSYQGNRLDRLFKASFSPNNTVSSASDRWNPILVVVNYSSQHAHGYVQLPRNLLRCFLAYTSRFSVASSFPHGAPAYLQELALNGNHKFILLRDVFAGRQSYRRSLVEAMTKGIWFSLEPYAAHIFEALLLDEV